MATQHGNIHAAIPLYKICNPRFQITLQLRTRKRKQSSLKPQQQCRNKKAPKRSNLHPPHTRGTFHRRPEPLYPKNTRFRAHTTSQNKASATSMLPLQCVLQHHVANPHLYAHGNTTWQQSCSHSTEICNPRFQITL